VMHKSAVWLSRKSRSDGQRENSALGTARGSGVQRRDATQALLGS
jgi:hypothetical protein